MADMERETGLEPEVTRTDQFYCVLSGLFSMQLVPAVLPCVSVYRRMVITRLSRSAKKLAAILGGHRPVNGASMHAQEISHVFTAMAFLD